MSTVRPQAVNNADLLYFPADTEVEDRYLTHLSQPPRTTPTAFLNPRTNYFTLQNTSETARIRRITTEEAAPNLPTPATRSTASRRLILTFMHCLGCVIVSKIDTTAFGFSCLLIVFGCFTVLRLLYGGSARWSRIPQIPLIVFPLMLA